MAASKTLTAQQRSMVASIGGHARWKNDDPVAAMAKVRGGLGKRYLVLVDPDEVLPVDERERRAHQAMLEHLAKMRLASSKARARSGGGR